PTVRVRATYRRLLRDLEEKIEEAQQFNDPGRAARAHEEIEALNRELSAAFGLGGRARKAGSATERARVNVRNSIAAALKTLERHHPSLARHLSQAIRTGTYCIYVGAGHWN